MNAIAFTREVLAVFGEPRRMAASTVLNSILRDAAKAPLLRMTSEIASRALKMTVPVCPGALPGATSVDYFMFTDEY
jgi:hypothetical protein